MLGPGMVVVGLVAALWGSVQALRFAPDRGFAIAALCVGMLELLAVLTLLVLTAIAFPA